MPQIFPQTDADHGKLVHLRILATSDIHVQLAAWDYHAATMSPFGLSRVAGLIAEERSANTLLLDNGDFLQGSPMADWVAAEGDGTGHPVIAAMNRMGYDAAALGNHEFNYGLGFLNRALEGAAFPVVSANVHYAGGGLVVPPWIVLERRVVDDAGTSHDLRIGVIGFLPPQIISWDRSVLGDSLRTEDMVAAARRHLPDLRARCDLVAALAHSGIGSVDQPEGSENAATAIAALDGIDAVIAGHSHLLFPSDAFAGLDGVDPSGALAGKPAVMPGFAGSHLGVIDLHLRPDDWRVMQATARLLPALGHAPDPAVEAGVAAAHAATLAFVERPVGSVLHPLDSLFGMVAPSAAMRLAAEALAEHVADHAGSDLPVLGTGVPFKCGGRGGPDYYVDIPEGDLALRHISAIYPYPNKIAALELTGAELSDWLEKVARAFRTIRPGEADQPLLSPDFPSYNFEVIYGLEFRIDLSVPPRFDADGRQVSDSRRILDLRRNGQPLNSEARFLLATSSYRAGHGGGFVSSAPAWSGQDGMRDIVAAHVAARSPLDLRRPPEWRFAPMPGTSVTFDTAPDARPGPETAHLELEPLGMTAEGFLRMRLSL